MENYYSFLIENILFIFEQYWDFLLLNFKKFIIIMIDIEEGELDNLLLLIVEMDEDWDFIKC